VKINHVPVYLIIESKTFEFEVVGHHQPQDEHHPEEFDINHLYHLRDFDQHKADFISLLDWPHVKDEVIKQLKAIKKDGNL